MKIWSKFQSGNLLLLLIIIVSGVLIYSKTNSMVDENIHEELNQVAEMSKSIIQSSVRTSIKNYLRGVVEKNLEITAYYHKEFQKGNLTEKEAKKQAEKVLSSQKVGKTGYLYVLDSQGVVIYHPSESLIGESQNNFEFIKKQIREKEGYIEYMWANPDEKKERKKALYMGYFEPWDWIVSASSYRSEFVNLINPKDLEEEISKIKIGDSGYIVLFDTAGKILFHPDIEKGTDLKNARDAEGDLFVQKILEAKDGNISYVWANSGESDAREKTAYFRHLPDLEWIVMASLYPEEYSIRKKQILMIIFITVLLAFLMIFIIILLNPSRKELRESHNQFKTTEEEKENLQKQLFHAQKIESVGRLAGGVAHDFNNMLGAILGQTELALMKINPDDTLYKHLKGIKKAAERSASLTNQLLAFARKQNISPEVLDLNKTITGMLDMLQRLIGENIELKWKPCPKIRPVKVDSSQIDQIITNLCVNAKDAISDTGKIVIETSNVTFDESHSGNKINFIKGDFVQISISDNGCGMSPEIKEHLFEPFFTTKEIGKGTGLGLATVHGIVKQNKGFINVYSEKEQGTVFNIYIPEHKSKEEEKSITAVKQEKLLKGSGTVLLVEDDPLFLEITKDMIEKLGYTVLCANTPGKALNTAYKYSDKIDILLTDVVMPEMNGRKLTKNILSIYPDIHCIFMSGYAANVIANEAVIEEGIDFLKKPFSIKDIADKFKKVNQKD